MLVQRVRGPQPADVGSDNFAAVVYFVQLALEVIDVALEAVACPHLAVEEVVGVLFEVLARDIVVVKYSTNFCRANVRGSRTSLRPSP